MICLDPELLLLHFLNIKQRGKFFCWSEQYSKSGQEHIHSELKFVYNKNKTVFCLVQGQGFIKVKVRDKNKVKVNAKVEVKVREKVKVKVQGKVQGSWWGEVFEQVQGQKQRQQKYNS